MRVLIGSAFPQTRATLLLGVVRHELITPKITFHQSKLEVAKEGAE